MSRLSLQLFGMSGLMYLRKTKLHLFAFSYFVTFSNRHARRLVETGIAILLSVAGRSLRRYSSLSATALICLAFIMSPDSSAQPSLTIISPNGNETWIAGRTYEIRWAWKDVTGTIQVQPYLNGVPQTNLAADAPSTGSLLWTIPPDYTPGTTYQMTVSAMGGTVSDFSDANFTISDDNVTVQSEPFTPSSGGGDVRGSSYSPGGTSADYSSARNQSPGSQARTNNYTIGQQAWYSSPTIVGYYNLYRSYLPFDTSSLPDDAQIVNAYIQFNHFVTAVDSSDFQINAVASTQSSTTSLTVHDYQRLGSSNLGSSPNASAFLDQNSTTTQLFALNATGRSLIDKQGITRLALRTSREISGSPPTDGDSDSWASEFTIVTNPKLYVEYYEPASLSRIEISGSPSVGEGQSTQLTCTAYFYNGSSSVVTNAAAWSIVFGPGTVSSTGLLTGGTVSSDQVVRVQASYQDKDALRDVLIVDDPPTLDRIEIADDSGGIVGENGFAQLSSFAFFSDGSGPVNVTTSTTWSEDSAFADIGQSTGLLTTSEVSSDQPVQITASYLTANAQHSMTIEDAAPPPPSSPTLISPANNAETDNPSVLFAWNAPSGEVTGYHLEVLKVGGGWDHNSVDISEFVTSETVNLPFLGPFTWRVRAKNGTDNWGPWSETRTVYVREPVLLSQVQQNQSMVEDPVNSATGAYTYSREDLSAPGRGLPFEFARFYNSRSTDNTAMGQKWRHTYLVELDDQGGEVTILWANGSKDVLVEVEGGEYINKYYGFSGTLTKNPDNTYDFVTKGLIKYHFDASGKLLTISDRNSNALTLNYDGQNRIDSVTDTAGRVFDFQYDANDRLVKLVDPLLRELVYTYDAQDDLKSFTDARGNTMTYTYDGSHNLTVINDRRGNDMVTNVFDGMGRVTSQTNARNKTWSFDYQLDGTTTVTDPDNNDTIYEYNEHFWLVKRIDPDTLFETYEYDESGNRTKVTNKRGFSTDFTYDERGNLLTTTDALLNTKTYAYNARDQVTSIVDALSRETKFAYDPLGNLATTTRPLGHITTFEYDAFGQLVELTDAIGNVTVYGYDGQGNRTSITNTHAETTEFEYDGVGRLEQITEPNTETTAFTYDANDNLKTTTDQENNATTYTYNANDNRTTVTNPRTFTTTTAYNPNNLVESITDANTNTAIFAYDNLDRLNSQTDRRGNTFTFEYDEVGNRTKSIDAMPTPNETVFQYDAIGNQTVVTNANSNSTFFTYDDVDRLTFVTDALGNQTQYVYDEVGRLVQLVDANLNTTDYEYDALDRLVKVTDAEDGSAQYTYDLNGNRTSIKDPNGNTTHFVYDALNRLVSETDALGKTITYAYDNAGNLASRTDGRGNTTEYTYDGAHRLTLVEYPDSSSVSFAYDANGNREQMVDSVGTTTWVYDTLDRITQVTDPYGNVVGYGYDEASNRDSITYPGPLTVNYTFDNNGRLESLTDWAAHTFTYSYDNAGNVTQLDYPSGAKEIRTYYANERLATLTHEKADATKFIDYIYTYDKAENITGMDRKEAVEREFEKELTDYTYNSGNEILTAGSDTFGFDGDGNQTSQTGSEGTTAFTFDFENRLTELDPPGADQLQFVYNGVGDRLETDDIGASTTTRYLLDLNKPLTDVLADLDNANTPQQYYLYGIGLVGRVTPSNTLYQYHPDHLGSIMAVSTETDVTSASFSYDEFGDTSADSGVDTSRWRFSGSLGIAHLYLSISNFRLRTMDSDTGRFVQRDPVRTLKLSQSLNRYPYVRNSPLRLVDPSGLVAFESSNRLTASNINDSISAASLSTSMTTAGSTPQLSGPLITPSESSVESIETALRVVCVPGPAGLPLQSIAGLGLESVLPFALPGLVGSGQKIVAAFCFGSFVGFVIADTALDNPESTNLRPHIERLLETTTFGDPFETTSMTSTPLVVP